MVGLSPIRSASSGIFDDHGGFCRRGDFIGGVELVGALVDKLGLKAWSGHSLPRSMTVIEFGLIVIGVFVSCWLLSVAIYRWRGYDNWSRSKVNVSSLETGFLGS